MSSVAIKNGELELFKRILKDGYAIGDGSETDRIVRELKRACKTTKIPIHHGYSQDTKKVIVALERPFKAKQKRRTPNKTLFELRRE